MAQSGESIKTVNALKARQKLGTLLEEVEYPLKAGQLGVGQVR